MLTGKEEGRATKYNHIKIPMHSDDHIKKICPEGTPQHLSLGPALINVTESSDIAI